MTSQTLAGSRAVVDFSDIAPIREFDADEVASPMDGGWTSR